MKKTFPLAIACLSLLALTQGALAQKLPPLLKQAESFTLRLDSYVEYGFHDDDVGDSSGTGFLIDKEKGWVLTNAHVSSYGTGDIEGAFIDTGYEPLRYVYVDTDLDLAVLAIEPSIIPATATAAQLDCTDFDPEGRDVVVYGHPEGLSFSATRGIVSKLRRDQYDDALQTDAAINSGNSGGAIIDIESGKVIGMSSSKLVDEEVEGIGFGVPARPICKVLDLLRSGKTPTPPKPLFRFASDFQTEEYLFVGAPYGNATLPKGIEIGDKITSVNGKEISSPTEYTTELRGIDGVAQLGILRGDKKIIVDVSITPQSNILDREYVMVDGALIANDHYDERFARFGNFYVHKVQRSSAARQQGLRGYTVISSIDGKKPESLDEIKDLLTKGSSVTFVLFFYGDDKREVYDYEIVEYTVEESAELKSIRDKDDVLSGLR